jgi:cellulose synthase/poly-beta-1,6-N-acetylglucosamine synthase-like glycosyltransferase
MRPRPAFRRSGAKSCRAGSYAGALKRGLGAVEAHDMPESRSRMPGDGPTGRPGDPQHDSGSTVLDNRRESARLDLAPGLRRMSTPTWLRRGVSVLVAVLVVGAALLVWGAVVVSDPHPVGQHVASWEWGPFSLLYSRTRPPAAVMLTALAVGLVAIAATAILTRWFLKQSRASLDPTTYPLSPHKIMVETRGRFDGPVTITVVVPAHNEGDRLGATLASLDAQSRRPDRVVVVADNCTDDTVAIAEAAGTEVIVTEGNTDKKAGALNQALRQLLPGARHNDVVMVMDADTVLGDGFLEEAARRFTDDRALMALGGVFMGEPGHGLIGLFQRNEYVRYARTVRRRRGMVDVLTGTSSLFRPLALRTVASSRGHALPGRPGDVYDTLALTEDNEITIALKTLGALMVSPSECVVVTELMPTWGDLWRQRLRWQRGAVENIGAYGLSLATLRYWGQQFGIGYGTIALTAYLACMTVLVLAADTWIWFPFWLGVGLVFALERVVTAWRAGAAGRAVAALLVPELVYDLFLDAVFVHGLAQIALARRASWGHESERTEAVGA